MVNDLKLNFASLLNSLIKIDPIKKPLKTKNNSTPSITSSEGKKLNKSFETIFPCSNTTSNMATVLKTSNPNTLL